MEMLKQGILRRRHAMGLGTMFSRMFSSGSERLRVGHRDDLGDGEMREVAVDVPASIRHSEGPPVFKVLLSRVHGEYYATGHLCPHFKARLVTGRISSDGRVICPWHAACFDVRSGDIEEAPSLRRLRSFPVSVAEDGTLSVTLSKDDVGPDSTAGLAVCEPLKDKCPDGKRIVILGGGPAGAAAAEEARAAGHTGEIVVLTAEPHLPIDRVKLSKSLNLSPDQIALFDANYLKSISIQVKTKCTTTGIDATKKTVTLADGSTLDYDGLILATGATPRRLPIPGAERALVLRTLEDCRLIQDAIDKAAPGKPKVAIIGASWIGLEAAAMLSKVSSEVYVIAPEIVPLERIMGKDVGQAIMRMHEALGGIKFHLGASIAEITGSGVSLKGGAVIEADIVILGVGVRPNTDFLTASGMALERDGSVAVGADMAVEGLEDVFAAGDIANFRRGDVRMRIEHWNVAMQQGRVAGRNAALALQGRHEESVRYESVPFFSSFQYGRSLRYVGSAQAGFDADVIFAPHPTADGANPGSPVFAAYYTQGERVVAVATMASDPVAAHCSELLRTGRMPTASQIRAGLNPLDVPY